MHWSIRSPRRPQPSGFECRVLANQMRGKSRFAPLTCAENMPALKRKVKMLKQGSQLRIHVAPALCHAAENPKGNRRDDADNREGDPYLGVDVVRVPEHARGADGVQAGHLLQFGHGFGALDSQHRLQCGYVAVPAAALAERSFLRQVLQRQHGFLPVMAIDIAGKLGADINACTDGNVNVAEVQAFLSWRRDQSKVFNLLRTG